MFSCHITGNLIWAPSEITCRNEEYHENVGRTENIDSSASGDSPYLSLNQNVCRKGIELLVRTFRLRFVNS
jgi:hypothetical protein